MQDLQPLIKNLMGFAQDRMGFERPPKLFLKQDAENSKKVFAKTAHYDPQEESVTIFVTDRHPKDILRSLAHELVHHTQNLRGDLSPEKCGDVGPGYAQNNLHMREMERQAYEQGNMCFRDWEDTHKKQLEEVKFLKESKKMAIKISKNELKNLIGKLLKKRINEQRMTSQERAAMIARRNQELGISTPGEQGVEADNLADRFGFNPAPGEPEYRADRDIKRMRDVDAEIMADREAAAADRRMLDQGRKIVTTADPNLAPEVIRKADQQKRLLRRAGFRDMKQLQRRVRAKQTGRYDLQTMKAIKAFQNYIGLRGRKADGVFGGQTRRALDRFETRNFTGKGVELPGISGDIKQLVPARTRVGVNQSLSDVEIEETIRATIVQELKKQKEMEEGHCTGASPGKDDDKKGKKIIGEKDIDEQMTDPDAPMSVSAKPDFPDVDGDGDTKEPISQAQKQKKEKEGGDSKNKSAKPKKGEVPPQLRKHVQKRKKGQNESKIFTPEKEQELYESRFNNRNNQIFDKLKKLWTK